MKKVITRTLTIVTALIVLFIGALYISINSVPAVGPYHHCSLIMSPNDECEAFDTYFCVVNNQLYHSRKNGVLEKEDFSSVFEPHKSSYVNEIEYDGKYLYILRNQELYIIGDDFKMTHSIEDYSGRSLFHSMAFDFVTGRLYLYVNQDNQNHLMMLDNENFQLEIVCSIGFDEIFEELYIDKNGKLHMISEAQIYHCGSLKSVATTTNNIINFSLNDKTLNINGSSTNQTFEEMINPAIYRTIYVKEEVIRFAIYNYDIGDKCLDINDCIDHYKDFYIYEYDANTEEITLIASIPHKSFLIDFSDNIVYYSSGSIFSNEERIKEIGELSPSGEFYLDWDRFFTISDARRITILSYFDKQLYIYDFNQ